MFYESNNWYFKQNTISKVNAIKRLYIKNSMLLCTDYVAYIKMKFLIHLFLFHPYFKLFSKKLALAKLIEHRNVLSGL